MTAERTPSLSSGALLSVRSLRKTYGGVLAVADCSLDVHEGEILSTIGPNGAGKTTVFNLVSGLVRANSGSVLLDGEELLGRLAHERAWLGIGRTFQNLRLFPAMSILENVLAGCHVTTCTGALAALLRPAAVRAEERAAVGHALEVLEFVDPALVRRRDDSAGALPYGLQRLLEIARAMATGPRLLMLDEPAAGMNATETQRLMELVHRIRASGVTVWLIEHDMTMVMSISDRIIVLHQGHVLADGEPAEIREAPAVIEAYLGIAAPRTGVRP